MPRICAKESRRRRRRKKGIGAIGGPSSGIEVEFVKRMKWTVERLSVCVVV